MTPRLALRGSPAGAPSGLWVLLLAVLAGLLALLGSLHAPAPPGSAAEPTRVPLEHRELACPAQKLKDKTKTSTVLVSSPFDGQQPGGTVTAAAGGDESAGRPVELTRRRPVVLTGASASGVLVVGDGPAAQGLQAVRVDEGRTTSAAVDCVEPGTDWWFVGAGASVSRTSELLLRNVDAGDASVSIRVFAPGGELDAGAAGQLVIPSGERARVDVSLLAPFHDTLSLWVHADRGRVAATMLNSVRVKALSQPARGWLSGQASPSRATRLVADFGSADRSRILVTNPGARDTLVSFEIAGKNGWFQTPDLAPVTVGPGEVVKVDASKALRAGGAAVRVIGNRPVVAAARLTVKNDVAHVEEAPTFGSSAVGVVPSAKKASVTVLGGGQGASVDVVSYDARGRELRRKSVDVAAGATVTTRLPDRTALVAVQPDSGGVSATVTVAGPGLAVLPLHGLVVSVLQPPVVPFSE